MVIANIFKRLVDALWLLGGIGAAADLSLEDFGPGEYEPCPREAEYPLCANLEASTCPLPCSISLPTRPYR